MIQRRRPSGFIEPCLPSKVARPPSGPLWVHEIEHDDYRLMRRDGSSVRCFARRCQPAPCQRVHYITQGRFVGPVALVASPWKILCLHTQGT
jgi:hypothetical protein